MTQTDERDRGLHRHGDLDPSVWEEQKTVAERPQDKPNPNTTFADRGKATKKTSTKKVSESVAEDKAVTGAQTKSRRKS